MNEYIFFTTEGYTYPPDTNKTIENCQLLGKSLGKNPKDAIKRLKRESPWIEDCGYNIEKAISKQLLSEDNKININLVLDYLLTDKFSHSKDSKIPDHIYAALLHLKNAIGI